MERYSMFWVGRINIVKMTYYQMQSTDSMQSLSNYQWHFSQNQNKKFHIHMESQKTPNSQSNLEKEEWNWKNKLIWFHTIPQSFSHKDNMVLAQNQKYRPMEHDRKPRDHLTHIRAPYLWQRRQEYTMGKRQSLQ